jgi:hypothetical protein
VRHTTAAGRLRIDRYAAGLAAPLAADLARLLVDSVEHGASVGFLAPLAIEEEARSLGRTTLVLDTETGRDAERLYARLGWERVGTIADYALDALGKPAATTVFTKRLP